MTIFEELNSRVLVLDGAMGTEVQKFNLGPIDFVYKSYQAVGNNDILNLSRPDVIEHIHQLYVEAGADIISTNTFSSNVISQAEYDTQDLAELMALQGARIAKSVANKAGRKVWVVGSIGSTTKALSLPVDVNNPEYRQVDFVTMASAFSTQIKALVEGGVDLLMLETCYDILNTKAAILAYNTLGVKVPMMISATVSDTKGRLLNGQTLEAFFRSVLHCNNLLSIGVNCSFGSETIGGFIEELQDFPYYISVHPNAGMPNEYGRYTKTPEEFGMDLIDLMAWGKVNIIGGCCGSGPSHIAKLKALAKYATVRQKPSEFDRDYLVGLDAVKASKLFIVGERCNVYGSKKFRTALEDDNYDEILDIALKEVDKGAMACDINTDIAGKGSKFMKDVVRNLNTEVNISKHPYMIDSSDWNTMVSGLIEVQGVPIANSISLKEGDDSFIKKATVIRNLGAKVVVMASDEQGQAVTLERRQAIVERAYRLLVKIGFRCSDIIFDLNVLAFGSSSENIDKSGIELFEALRWVKTQYSNVKTIMGLSNISYSFKGSPLRKVVNRISLLLAHECGLDMAIADPDVLKAGNVQVTDEQEQLVKDVLLGREEVSKLVELAFEVKGNNLLKETKITTDEDVVMQAVIQGKREGLTKSLDALITRYDAISIIESFLVKAMDIVSKKFQDAEMFLPQVVKSAKIMKSAVDYLNKFMPAKDTNKGLVILATVRGDVHDIGKNIVSTLLECSGYKVKDLGVMVEPTVIYEAVAKYKPIAVGVSALITPSLYEVQCLCNLLNDKEVTVPLIVGGAAVSDKFVRTFPEYTFTTWYGGDATNTVKIINQLHYESIIRNRTSY